MIQMLTNECASLNKLNLKLFEAGLLPDFRKLLSGPNSLSCCVSSRYTAFVEQLFYIVS